MRDIILIGINHKTAPVEVRECIAFDKDESAAALETLRRTPFILEALLYSTCNRVELLVVTDDKARAVEAAKQFISGRNNIPWPGSKTAFTSTKTITPSATCFEWPPAWIP